MSAPECRKPVRGSTCIARLADGWILPTDLCPVCTRSFMIALDGVEGPLRWHPSYTGRVTDATDVTER